MFITPQRVRELTGAEKDIPLYYIDKDFYTEVTKAIDLEIKVGKNQEVQATNSLDKLREYSGYRPFDKVIIVSEESIVYFDGTHDIPRTWVLSRDSGIWHKTTIRENFNVLDMDVKRDLKILNFNAIISATALYPFSLKKSVINLVETRTSHKTSKGKTKAKKSKIVVLSDKYFTYENSPGKKTYASYPCTKVAGHRRFYRKNPNTKGHDRSGNLVFGWTWVSPYTKGEGKELFEKIRFFQKS